MRRCAVLLLLASLLARAVPARAEPTRTLWWQGRIRSYLVHLPRGSDGRGRPLVLVLHGGGGTARGMARMTGFDAVADAHGFVVVYPAGVRRQWNDGRQFRSLRRSRADDVGFLTALVDRLERSPGVDPHRVYATGISNGGLMSYRLACERSDRFAAVAPVAALQGARLSRGGRPARGVSVFVIEGTADPLMPFDGGQVHLGPLERGEVLSMAETVKFWVARDGCPPASERRTDGVVHKARWGGGRDGSEVQAWSIQGAGHTWPNGPQYLPAGMVGTVCRDFNASEEIWRFFARHRR